MSKYLTLKVTDVERRLLVLEDFYTKGDANNQVDLPEGGKGTAFNSLSILDKDGNAVVVPDRLSPFGKTTALFDSYKGNNGDITFPQSFRDFDFLSFDLVYLSGLATENFTHIIYTPRVANNRRIHVGFKRGNLDVFINGYFKSDFVFYVHNISRTLITRIKGFSLS